MSEPYTATYQITWHERRTTIRTFLAHAFECNERNWPLPVISIPTMEQSGEGGSMLIYPMLDSIKAYDARGADLDPLDRGAVSLRLWGRKVRPDCSLGAGWGLHGTFQLSETFDWREPRMSEVPEHLWSNA